MVTVNVIALSFLIATALSGPVEVNETMILFHGEDFHIQLPSLGVEVIFRKTSSSRPFDVTLMKGAGEIHKRAKLNQQLSHLVIEAVGEDDEGLYTVKHPEKKDYVIKLIVRDCSNEEIIIYGDNFRIPLTGVNHPITLEYRSIAVEANQTHRPGTVVLTATGESKGPGQGRINVGERYVTLMSVTGEDEGSYTVRDDKGDIQRKVCLNVKEHQNFVTLPYGKRLKINLILNSSLVHVYYSLKSNSNNAPRLLLDKGKFTNALTELGLEDRLSLEGSLMFLEKVTHADEGEFKITDQRGVTVSRVDLTVLPYKLETLYVAIIALLGLLVFLLLVCLLSCLIKVKKRAKRAAALEKIAQNAGKEEEGEAFRQVVKNITKLSEESKHSQADNTEKSQSTEVDIKGLEVSSKEVGVGNLETSDSGVGFNTALPLDTDTDAADQIPDSEAVSISVAPALKSSPPSAAESKPSAPPVLEIQPSPVPETKVSPAPETKKTPDPPMEVKLDAPKPADVKLSPAPSPEPKAGLSPADPKPALSPSPEPKPATPKATTPTPESKSALAPTPEPPKPTTPEPITNGTPEPGLDSKPSPDHADVIGGSAPKAVPPKTPEVELKSSGAALEASKDVKVAEDSTTTT